MKFTKFLIFIQLQKKFNLLKVVTFLFIVKTDEYSWGVAFIIILVIKLIEIKSERERNA